MESIDAQEDVSDPLKHLLSLDWNSSVTLTTIENSFEPPKSVKRVRFSDEVKKFSYEINDERNFDTTFSHGDNSHEQNFDPEITIEITNSCNNKTGVFTDIAECIDLELPSNNGANVGNSTLNNLLTNSNTEINVVLQKVEDSVDTNTDINGFLLVDNDENSRLKSSVDSEEQTSDLNDITVQVKNLCLENASLENITPVSLAKPVLEPSSIKKLNIEGPIDELKSNTSNGSSKTSRRRAKNKSFNQKQSSKLNSVLIENSCYSSASELHSVVFKAWCDVKNETKTVIAAVSSENNMPNRSTTNSAYLTWKKSKIQTRKKAKKDKSSLDFSNVHQENLKNSKEEIDLAFKAWKKKKDEMLKLKLCEKFDKEQENVMESLMEKKEKKMEAEAAFNAWKQHKSNHLKMEKNKRAWIMQKKKEEEEKKAERDREALFAYHMWLESKKSNGTFSPVEAKPPWTPPGK